jgi:hypothetical protein
LIGPQFVATAMSAMGASSPCSTVKEKPQALIFKSSLTEIVI